LRACTTHDAVFVRSNGVSRMTKMWVTLAGSFAQALT
jgi:hypothetical protein